MISMKLKLSERHFISDDCLFCRRNYSRQKGIAFKMEGMEIFCLFFSIFIFWIFPEFFQSLFLTRHPMMFIFLNLFDLLESPVMLMTLILVIRF